MSGDVTQPGHGTGDDSGGSGRRMVVRVPGASGGYNSTTHEAAVAIAVKIIQAQVALKCGNPGDVKTLRGDVAIQGWRQE